METYALYIETLGYLASMQQGKTLTFTDDFTLAMEFTVGFDGVDEVGRKWDKKLQKQFGPDFVFEAVQILTHV